MKELGEKKEKIFSCKFGGEKIIFLIFRSLPLGYWSGQLLFKIKSLIFFKIVQTVHGGPLIAVVVPKKENALNIAEFKKEMVDICRENRVCLFIKNFFQFLFLKLDPPDQLAILPEFPRVNTKIQKYKIRQDLKNNKLKIC